MVTNKKAISAYIPSDIEEYLIKYCTEYDITRKDKSGEIKPALGTAVVEILRIFFSDDNNVSSPLPDNVPLLPSNVITEDRLSEVLSKLKASSNVPSILPDNVLTKDNLNKQIEAAIDEAIPKAVVDIKNDEQLLRAIALEVQKITSEDTLLETEIVEDGETTTQVDQASLSPIFDELEKSETGKLLSKKEAHKIAQQRGYKSSDTAFAQWFRDHRDKTLHGISKHSDRGKYIDFGE